MIFKFEKKSKKKRKQMENQKAELQN